VEAGLTDTQPLVSGLYNAESRSFVTAAGSSVLIWDALSGRLLRKYTDVMPTPITAMCLDDRERKLILADHKGKMVVLNYSNGALMKPMQPHAAEVSALLYISEGDRRHVMSASWDRTLLLQDESQPDMGKLIRSTPSGHACDVTCAAYSASYQLIASGADDGSLLVWRHMDPSASAKVAAFDFDGCLANTPLGGNDPNAWSMQFPHVPVVLAKLAASGHTLVVVTNESMDRLKKPEAIAACLRKKCGRLEGFAKAAGLPLLVLCATAKDGYRKPGQGCWTFLTSTAYPGLVVDKSASCFVGDAAGRPGDHSDSDRAFAQAAAIPFFDEKTFFLRRHPQGS